ncbi:MAG: hydrogenase 2 operon protein HybA [Thermodesulfobacteriota bacterium]
MGLSRRDFLKAAAGGGLALASNLSPAPVLAREPVPRLPDALGILYDATLCIGCKACMAACKKANNLPPELCTPDSLWDDPVDLSAKTVNIIKLYKNGTGLAKDQEINGYSFIRQFCMHCVDPSCVSACPVSALTKDQQTGLVRYDKDNCIGCRYCQVACPYNIPKFQWDQAFPQIVKCQLCDHLIAQGGYSACCEFCPTGASIFGNVQHLREEAHRRLSFKPGEFAEYPLHRVESRHTTRRQATPYLNHVFGEREGGGTQVLMLANVPFNKLGFPLLPPESQASRSETLYHTLYKGMILPYVLLGGLFYLIYKNTTGHDLP